MAGAVHELAQARCAHAAEPHLQLQAVCCISQAVSSDSNTTTRDIVPSHRSVDAPRRVPSSLWPPIRLEARWRPFMRKTMSGKRNDALRASLKTQKQRAPTA